MKKTGDGIVKKFGTLYLRTWITRVYTCKHGVILSILLKALLKQYYITSEIMITTFRDSFSPSSCTRSTLDVELI